MRNFPAGSNILHKQAYDKSCQELFKRQLSNNENLDKSILTLASGGLALTITFVGNLKSVHCIPLLVLCWAAFFVAIVSTIVSYLASQRGITKQLELLRRYHKERDDSAETERNRAAELNEHLACVSVFGFIAGVLLLLTFFGINATTENLGKKPIEIPPIVTPQGTPTQP